MFFANLATLALYNAHLAATWLFQDAEGGAVGWDPVSLWKQMGILAKIVVIILFIMSGWSIGVMIDRALAFSAARKQSRAFAPAVAGETADPGHAGSERLLGAHLSRSEEGIEGTLSQASVAGRSVDRHAHAPRQAARYVNGTLCGCSGGTSI